MSDYAPDAIRAVFTRARELMPSSDLLLSGILGDEGHYLEGGYHVPRGYLERHLPGDYSIQRPEDRRGDPEAAAALDIKPGRNNTATMELLTHRLILATRARDPRIVHCVREFFGTVNGRDVTGRDVPSGRAVSSDPSHLWHLHISFDRDKATDPEALAGVADVLAGVPLDPTPEPAPEPIREDDEMLLVYVDRRDTDRRRLAWPGVFMLTGKGLAHVATEADVKELKDAGVKAATLSYSTYRNLGGPAAKPAS